MHYPRTIAGILAVLAVGLLACRDSARPTSKPPLATAPAAAETVLTAPSDKPRTPRLLPRTVTIAPGYEVRVGDFAPSFFTTPGDSASRQWPLFWRGRLLIPDIARDPNAAGIGLVVDQSRLSRCLVRRQFGHFRELVDSVTRSLGRPPQHIFSPKSLATAMWWDSLTAISVAGLDEAVAMGGEVTVMALDPATPLDTLHPPLC